MGTFLNKQDLGMALKIGRVICVLFCVPHIILGIVLWHYNFVIPAMVSYFISAMYIIVLKAVRKDNINVIAFAIHTACILYACSMNFYFGWDFGAEYFLLPCIAFCYVGDYKSSKIVYLIAFIQTFVFELLYYLIEVKNIGFSYNFVVNGKNLDEIFYIGHSFIATSIIFLAMYLLRIRLTISIKDKEETNLVLEYNASIDSLTALLNRRAFIEKIKKQKDVNNFCFAIIDIDFFKKINDNYGHNAGDEVLRVCATLLNKNFSDDIVCRWGGEEFVVFSTRFDKENFYEKCDNFRKEFANYPFYQGQFLSSVSIGAAIFKIVFNYNDFDKYIQLIDNNLYYVKNNGKNSVLVKEYEYQN